MVSASGAVAAVTPVPVARIVMVLVATGVAAVVVSCNVVVAPVPVLGFGVNVAVTPAGRFSAAKVTSPVKLVRARAMVVVPFAPRAIVNAAGVSVNPMLAGGGAAVIVIGSVAVRFPATGEVPVSVRVAAPNVALGAAVTVSVEVLPVAVVGDRVAVTPVGAPVTVRPMSPVKPVRVMLTVLVPLAPCATDNVVGVNARPSVPPVTVSVYGAPTAETPSPVATTVIG